MDPSFEQPDEKERLQINLEDDVRAFLLSRLLGNRLDPEQLAELVEEGVEIRQLRKPSYLYINSNCDLSEDEEQPPGCGVGAEGVMVHEEEAVVHLAFKCGDAEHEMHYSTFMPLSVIEMAKAMESVWPGSIAGPLMHQALKLGRTDLSQEIEIDAEGAERLMEAMRRMDEEGPDFDLDDEPDFEPDFETGSESDFEDDLFL